MTPDLDRDWATEVVALCDPVFAAADVGFEHQLMMNPDGTVQSLLWEATPALFEARYPDSDIAESYGNIWPDVHCIDYWVYLNEPGFARLSIEGWDVPELYIKLQGNPWDGYALRGMFARILGVTPPELD